MSDQLVKQTPLDWAKSACDALMEQYAPSELPPANRWHYHQGVFLCGMEQLWETVQDDRYDAYIQRYVDELVDERGNFPFARDELDAIQPGLLLFRLYHRTGAAKYRIAANKLRYLFHTLHRTSEGGFWHKDKYPYQMWLDGLYMGGVFALKYADAFGEGELRDMVLRQQSLMRKHMKDERTGLLYHAWDEQKAMAWSDPVTGCSPEFWGRSLGWYGLALADFVELLPAEVTGRLALKQELADFVQAFIRYQDQASGLWYQVVDKGDQADNWLETSCSSLFVYTIAKAIRLGCIAKDADAITPPKRTGARMTVAEAALRGYEGLVTRMKTDEHGRFVMPDICIGTSAGDYANYVTRPTSNNDLHGVGAFVMACVEIHRLQRNLARE